jgi:type IV pilus assembly protein PilB
MKESELIDRLKKAKVINDDQIKKAIELKKNIGGNARIADILVKLGYVKRSDLNNILTEESREYLPPVDIANHAIDLEAMGKIPKEFIEEHRCVVFESGKGKVLLALANPEDFDAIEDVKFLTGKVVEAGFAPAEGLDKLILEYYKKPEQERAAARVGGDVLLRADPARITRALALLLIRRGIISKTDLENELERQRPK